MSPKILIVDDRQELLGLWEEWANNFKAANDRPDLEIVGVTTFEAAEQAILAAPSPCLLVTDVELCDLEGRSGLDLLPLVKEANQSAKAIVMSANRAHKIRALELGADIFLEKPIGEKLFCDTLKGLI